MADFRIEKKYLKEGYKIIAGVDEVGRGALFGPVVAAAVILPERVIRKRASREIEEIDDSKALRPHKRKRLAWFILSEALSVGVGLASNREIDQENIYWASLRAMNRAIQSLSVNPEIILVDGFPLQGAECPQVCLPQGDRKSITIAAASIIAKVVRDKMMIFLDRVYSGYSLAKNKGYGTREHYQALREIGPTPFHRFTFYLGEKEDGINAR